MDWSTFDSLKALAPTGTLRLAINYGNAALAQRDAQGGPSGIAIDLARAVGARFEAAGIAHELVGFDAAGKLMAALPRGEWDIGFLAVDPVRAEQLAFTPAYVQIAACYLVRADAGLDHPDDVDTTGRTVAVGRGAAYDLHLTRSLKHARIERFATAAEAFAQFESVPFDAAAGVRRVVQNYAASRPGLQAMATDFLAIEQALCVPRQLATAQPEAFRFLCEVVEDAKRSGAIAEAIARSGQADVGVAPPADPDFDSTRRTL